MTDYARDTWLDQLTWLRIAVYYRELFAHILGKLHTLWEQKK